MRKLLVFTALSAICFASSPSFAASAETEAFVANVRLDAVFLASASDLAADRSENTDLRAFAGRESVAQKAAVATVDLRTSPEVEQVLPMAVASNDVLTGRSAALDSAPATPDYVAPAGTGALMPAAVITLDRLAGSKGQAFDSLYKATQIDALRQLARLYNAYGMTGDDVALKQLSKNELAATHDRIADLARF